MSENTVQFKAFDTLNTVTVYDGDASVLSLVKDRCMYFESIFSRFIESSDISRINASSGEPVNVSYETADILSKSIYYHRLSEGYFDITVHGKASGRCADIFVDGSFVVVPEGVSLDLGGIAKGYIADDLKARLEDARVTCASINLGGNILVLGHPENRDHWTVGIQKPFAPVGEPVAAVKLSSGSMVTSGIYERFSASGGFTHHIIDPFTGKSAVTDVVSATLVCPSSTAADAMTTACLCAGSEKAKHFASLIPHSRLLLILTDGSLQWFGPPSELQAS